MSTKIYTNRREELREILKAAPDGIDEVTLIHDGATYSNIIRGALRSMPDAYIDRWVMDPKRKKYVPVWCVVDVPENCPEPTYGKTLLPPPPETRPDDPGGR